MIFTSICFGLFVIEYICTIKKYQYKPSYYMSIVSTFAQKCFSYIGRQFAWLSSFYTLIQFGTFVEVLHNMVKPIYELAISPCYMVYEYVKQMDLYKHKYLIPCGSATIIVITFYIMYNYFELSPYRLYSLFVYHCMMLFDFLIRIKFYLLILFY